MEVEKERKTADLLIDCIICCSKNRCFTAFRRQWTIL